MTPDELREAIFQAYGVRRGGAQRLAHDLGVHGATVRTWLAGKSRIPGPASLIISVMREGERSAAWPRPRGMAPDELRAAISRLYEDRLVSQRQHRLALSLGVSPGTVTSWLSGRRRITPLVETAVRLMIMRKDRDAPH